MVILNLIGIKINKLYIENQDYTNFEWYLNPYLISNMEKCWEYNFPLTRLAYFILLDKALDVFRTKKKWINLRKLDYSTIIKIYLKRYTIFFQSNYSIKIF